MASAEAFMLSRGLLGPLFLGGSVGFEGGGRFYIALGPLFR